MTEVLKAPKPSPVKTDSCNPFHNRTQDGIKKHENWPVLNLSISKDREWVVKAPRVGLLNTYCASKNHAQGDQTNCRFWRRRTEMPLCVCAKDHSWHFHSSVG